MDIPLCFIINPVLANSNILCIVRNNDMKVCEAAGLAETRVLRSVLDIC